MATGVALDKAPHRVWRAGRADLHRDRIALVRGIRDHLDVQRERRQGRASVWIGMCGTPRVIANTIDLWATARTAEIPQDMVEGTILHEHDHDVFDASDVGWHIWPPHGQGVRRSSELVCVIVTYSYNAREVEMMRSSSAIGKRFGSTIARNRWASITWRALPQGKPYRLAPF